MTSTCDHVFMKLREGLYPAGQDYVCARCGATCTAHEKALFDTPMGTRH